MSADASQGSRRPWLLATVVWMAAISGAVNLATQSWSAFFRLNLLLHPALALVALALVLREVLRRLRSGTARTPWSFRIGLVVLFVVLPARSWVLGHVATIAPDAVDGRLVLPAVVIGIALLLHGLVGPARSPGGGRTVLASIAVTLPWLMATAIGSVILLRSGGGHDRRLFNVHALWGGLAAVTGWLVSGALGAPGERVARWLRALAIAAAGLVGVAGLANLALGVSGSPQLVEVRTDPRPAAAAARVPTFGTPLDATWLAISDGCGAAGGCHPEIVAESRRSLHGAASRARLRSIPELASRFGSGCLGCHVPSGLAALAEAAPAAVAMTEADSIGCILCHSVEEASVDPPWGASYRLRLDADLLTPFRTGALVGGWRGQGERHAIGLNARAHGRAFHQPVLSDDRLCHTCHHLQIRALTVGIPCRDCHMPRAARLGDAGEHRSHLFVGANLAMATALGDALLAEREASWVLGACLIDTPSTSDEGPDSTLPPVPPEAFQRPCLPVAVRLTTEPASGRERLEVRTSNPWMTHPFPSGSLDAVEAWLEVRVSDEAGRAVLAVGGVGDDGVVRSDAPRLGDPTQPAAQGVSHPLPSSDARQLLPGDERIDSFELPAGSEPASALDVSVEWKYRKVTPAAWAATGGEGMVPTLTVARRVERLPRPTR